MTNVVSLNERQEVLNDLGDYGGANFTVESKPIFFKEQVHYPNPDDNWTVDHDYPDTDDNWTVIKNKKALVRTDTNESLTVVSDSYQVAQHPDAFRTVERIIAGSDLDLTDIKRTIETSHNGARAYARYTFPAHEIETSRGDSATLEMLARNSFDGSWCFHVDIGAIRMACLNGQVFIEDFAFFKSKHTRGLNMAHAARKLSKSLEVYENEVERWKKWKRTEVADYKAFNIFSKAANCKYAVMPGVETVSSVLEEREVSRNKTLIKLWNHYATEESKSLGSNLWAVYNTLTHWATHAPAGKKTAQHNIAAIKVRRQDKVREVFKGLAIAA